MQQSRLPIRTTTHARLSSAIKLMTEAQLELDTLVATARAQVKTLQEQEIANKRIIDAIESRVEKLRNRTITLKGAVDTLAQNKSVVGNKIDQAATLLQELIEYEPT